MTQKGDFFLKEHTCLSIQLKVNFFQTVKVFLYIAEMSLKCLTIDDNVVYVNKLSLISKACKYSLHQSFEYGWKGGGSKWHNFKLQ